MLRLMTVLAALFLLLAPLVAPHAHTAASALPAVTTTGVAADNSSVKVAFDPVPGAKDYRIYDVSDPTLVKYAGMVHLSVNPWCQCHFQMQADGVTPVYPYAQTPTNSGSAGGPTTLDVPNTEIEWNGLDSAPHTLVVQALDALGPVPPANLYDANNSPLNPPAGMLGANTGATPDGLVSINGQGPYTDTPQVIAQSAPFTVQASPSYSPLSPTGTQQFYDTFPNSEPITGPVGLVDPAAGTMTYTLGLSPTTWLLRYQGADTTDSMPFIKQDHFMDMLFDGGTLGTSNPPHTQYGVMAMEPQTTFDFSGGRVLHVTTEVDAHQDNRRWMTWYVVPATDPIQQYLHDTFVNSSGDGFQARFTPGGCATSVTVAGTQYALAGAAGQAPNWCADPDLEWGGNGRGLDNRSRIDLFLSQSQYALYEDGTLVSSAAISPTLPFTAARVSIAHYLYHSALDHQELQQYSPWEQYWLNEFPYSDERHWDNMGAEVLPASTDWSALGRLVQPPAFTAPQTTTLTPTATATPPTVTATATPPTVTATATPPTVTATASAVPRASATPNPWPTVTAQAGVIQAYQTAVAAYQRAIADIKAVVTPFP